jgi:plasmid stability protein
MASITIRRLDDAVKEHLRVRAFRHGRSMEEEAREILTVALAVRESTEPNAKPNWVESFRRRVAAVGGVELPDLPREPMREPPDFGE